MDQLGGADGGCDLRSVDSVQIVLEAGAPDYEVEEAAAIDVHWAAQIAAKPTIWDGRVHFVRNLAIDRGVLSGTARQARFATLIHWRDHGFQPMGWRHIFGAAVLRASDGAFLLGRMAEHTANAGWVYFPGGAIDEKDIRQGSLDPALTIARELLEETGLNPSDTCTDPGFQLAVLPEVIAVAQVIELPWDGEKARERISASMTARGDQELSEILVVRGPEDLTGLMVKPYARAVIEAASKHEERQT